MRTVCLKWIAWNKMSLTIKLYLSSSSCHAASTDLPGPLAIRPYRPSLLGGLQGYILYRHKAVVYRFWHFHLTQPRAAPRRKLLVWSRRAPKVNRLPRTLKLNWLFSNPCFRCMTPFTFPGLFFHLGILFWHLLITHPPCARVNTCAHVTPN